MKYYVYVKYNLCKVWRILYIDILVDQKGLICMYVVKVILMIVIGRLFMLKLKYGKMLCLFSIDMKIYYNQVLYLIFSI